jgi:hypothetical protein
MTTSEQVCIAVGTTMMFNLAASAFVYAALSGRLSRLQISFSASWRSELRRVEERLDARIERLEKRVHPPGSAG